MWSYQRDRFDDELHDGDLAELEAIVEAIREKSLNVGAFGTPEEVLETLLGAQNAKGFGELHSTPFAQVEASRLAANAQAVA